MTPQLFDRAHARYLAEQRRGVLATIAPDGAPQAKPVGFGYDPQRETIEVSGYDMEHSAKFGNIGVHPHVAFTVEDVPDPAAGAEGVRFAEIRGIGERVRLDDSAEAGLSSWIIRIHPHRLVSYNVAGPGLHAADLGGEDSSTGDARPVVGLSGEAAERAHRAVQRQIDELQSGLDTGEAETYNRHFARDLMWGSPYGAIIEDYDTLHAIHHRLLAGAGRGRCRYETVRVLAVAPDVTLAQVRRSELDERGEPIPSHEGQTRFSEMALYVLVRRDGDWWLAAGQNTVVNVDRGAVQQ
jgi:PPOX class F420-dependent enzyme/OxyR family protein